MNLSHLESTNDHDRRLRHAKRMHVAQASVASLFGVRVTFEKTKPHRQGRLSLYEIDGCEDRVVGLENLRLKMIELTGEPLATSSLCKKIAAGEKIGGRMIRKLGNVETGRRNFGTLGRVA